MFFLKFFSMYILHLCVKNRSNVQGSLSGILPGLTAILVSIDRIPVQNVATQQLSYLLILLHGFLAGSFSAMHM